MNSKKLSLNNLNKNELIKCIPSQSKNKISYAAAVTSNSKNLLNELTLKLQPLTKAIPQGHPNTTATGMFLAKQHNKLETELPHEQMGVFYTNNTTMDSTTTRQLNLPPDLPSSAQKGHAFNEMDKTLVSVPVL